MTTESEGIRLLLKDLEEQSLLESSDRLLWYDGSNIFTVKSCYNKVLEVRLRFYNEGMVHYNWSRLCLKSVPLQVDFLVWLLICDKVLTQSNL